MKISYLLLSLLLISPTYAHDGLLPHAHTESDLVHSLLHTGMTLGVALLLLVVGQLATFVWRKWQQRTQD